MVISRRPCACSFSVIIGNALLPAWLLIASLALASIPTYKQPKDTKLVVRGKRKPRPGRLGLTDRGRGRQPSGFCEECSRTAQERRLNDALTSAPRGLGRVNQKTTGPRR